MTIQEYVKSYNLSFTDIQTQFHQYFNELSEEDRLWLGNVENKLYLLNDKATEEKFNHVINKLKTGTSFNVSDTDSLSIFISKINKIINIVDRLNNFKENTILQDGSELRLYELFNSITPVKEFKDLDLELNANLKNFLPHLFSIIKHCQNPKEYPIYYKLWKNILKEVLGKKHDYDNFCLFYRTFPESNRHLQFGAYLGTIGYQIAKNIKQYFPNITKESKEYNFLINDVINLKRYRSILDNELEKTISTDNNIHKLLVNISWNSKDWKEESNDKSNHRWVKEGGTPGESWNFASDAEGNTDEHIFGYAKFTSQPKIKGSSIFIFYSQNKIVGFYGNAEIINKPLEDNGIELNLKGDQKLSFVLENKIDNAKELGFLEDKERVGMINFNYLHHNETVLQILYKALELNPQQEAEITLLKNWFIEQTNFKEKEINYWIFQGDPKIYNTIEALKSKAIKTWTVNAHKEKIKVNDKFILWLTGEKSGCYALGKITSAVQSMKEDDDEMRFYLKQTEQLKKDRVNIIIEHNLSENPILFDSIKDNPLFSKFKGGTQGTNFSATKSEYEYFLNREKNMDTLPLNKIFFGPPGTGKTFALNTILKKLKSNPEIVKDNTITVNQDKVFWHLAPGQGGYLWDTLKKSNRLGYEWCGNSQGDLKKLSRDKTDNYSIRNYFSYVKKGDYFCIVSGKKFYGIAEALSDYDYNKAITKEFDFQTIEVKWIKIFDTPELLSTSYTPTFGKLNGGKRWESLVIGLNNNNIYLKKQTNSKEEPKPKHKNYLFTTFHQSLSYEDFIEGIKPDLEGNDELRYVLEDGIFKTACDIASNLAGYEDLQDAMKHSKEDLNFKFGSSEPFYLCIDEINRGNVSAIFGELITLIEDDKRLGKENEIRLTLPYSKKEFCVPPNLHIIGTMNTADRSVEALDTALRRRFSFEEMPPLYDLDGLNYKISEYDAFDILKTINSRIEKLIDKDHAIGHSYFLNKNNKTIIESFYKNIIPLLQEYFFGDYGKIGLILGKGFIKLKEYQTDTTIFADFDTDSANDFDERNVFEIIDYRKVKDYKVRINKNDLDMDFEKAIQVLMNRKFD